MLPRLMQKHQDQPQENKSGNHLNFRCTKCRHSYLLGDFRNLNNQLREKKYFLDEFLSLHDKSSHPKTAFKVDLAFS